MVPPLPETQSGPKSGSLAGDRDRPMEERPGESEQAAGGPCSRFGDVPDRRPQTTRSEFGSRSGRPVSEIELSIPEFAEIVKELRRYERKTLIGTIRRYLNPSVCEAISSLHSRVYGGKQGAR